MKTYKVPVNIEVTEEQLDDIVDAAISYNLGWCDLLEYGKEPKDCEFMSQALSHGGTLMFNLEEPFDEEREHFRYELTTEDLLRGIAEYGNFDFDDFDGPIADAVVQQALFGEVVYG